LVCNQPLPPTPPGVTATLLYTTRPGVILDEQFRVYRFDAR
jgi:hypothetical protein